jgi:hypothetical protein
MSPDQCRTVTINLLNEWAGRIVAEQAIPRLTVALCQGGGRGTPRTTGNP